MKCKEKKKNSKTQMEQLVVVCEYISYILTLKYRIAKTHQEEI